MLTWSLILRKKHGLRVFENKVLKRIFGPKKEEQGDGENYNIRSFLICTFHQILLG
jgi:hypothetical protein